MDSSNNNRSGAASAQVFMALFAVVLVMGLGAMALPAEAAPFAYVANGGDGTVSVIDTATNTVVGIPIPVGREPFGLDVTPDGKHAYVANRGSNNLSVIDTASNLVVATVVVGNVPINVAVTPDGNHAYVANAGSWKPRLCRECRLQQRFGDRHGREHGGAHGHHSREWPS
jgi:YVTN family beta-propeller protein